jgi:DNA-binding MarR family transcriptional regulator
MRNNRGVEDDARELLAMFEEFSRRDRVSLRDPMIGFIESHGLTPPQIHSVFWLGKDGPLTMGELAQRIGVTEKTITGIVDRLERSAHVVRERDDADRRVVRVKLTRQGHEAHAKLAQDMLKKAAALLSLLDVEDRQALRRIVRTLLERAAAMRSAGAEAKTEK